MRRIALPSQEVGRAGRDGLPSWCIYRMKGGHALAALSGIFGIYRQTREEYGEDLLGIIREQVSCRRRKGATNEGSRFAIISPTGKVYG